MTEEGLLKLEEMFQLWRKYKLNNERLHETTYRRVDTRLNIKCLVLQWNVSWANSQDNEEGSMFAQGSYEMFRSSRKVQN